VSDEKPDQSQDTTRDWSGEEVQALQAQRQREAELLRKQREKE